MKKINLQFKVCGLFVILFLVSAAGIFAQPSQQWIKSYNNTAENDDDGCIKSVTDSHGNVYVLGSTRTTGGDYNIVTIKYDANGNLKWNSNYGSITKSEVPEDIKVDVQGNVYVSGYGVNQVTGMDALLIKYDSTGSFKFVRRINRTTYTDRVAYAMSITLQGGYIWVGCSFQYNNTSQIGLVRFTSSGDSIGYIALDIEAGNGSVWLNRLYTDDQNNVYAGGYGKFTQGEDFDIAIYKVNFNAQFVWSKIYTSSNHGGDLLYDIKTGPDGNLFVAGSSFQNNQGSDILTLKVGRDDASIIWEKRYNNSTANQDDIPQEITFDNNNNILVTGRSKGIGTEDDVVILKYTPAGSLAWQKTINSGGSNVDWPKGIVCDNSNNIYISYVAYDYGASTINFVTAKYSSAGAADWSVNYAGASNFDGPQSINIDNAGSIIVSGTHSDQNTKQNIVTIKYGSTIGIQSVSNTVPDKFSLSQNYPNPFNPTTNIDFSISRSGNVKIVVFDITGKQVAELVNKQMTAGTYKIDFDASHLATGVYFYKLITSEFSEVKKMMLVK